jgi:phosphoenolpyruvate-protein phosphotransferase (PTS system enzyme I)
LRASLRLRGAGVSAGVAIGPALVVEREATTIFRIGIGADAIPGEIQRFRCALEQARCQLRSIRDRLLKETGPHAHIFDAQLLMIDDPLLAGRSEELVRERGINAEWALRQVAEDLHRAFAEYADEYFKERLSDLDDVIGRIQLNLQGQGEAAPSLSRLPCPSILVIDDLPPSLAAEMDWDNVLAVVTDAGSPTYHTAILARSLNIPGVVGLKDATRLVPPDSLLVVDGAQGVVVIDPAPDELQEFRGLRQGEEARQVRLQATRDLQATSRDGIRVSLQANAEFEEEAARARLYGAQGIGLFRSEYLLGRARAWPEEEAQVDLYRRLIEQMHPYPVTVRVWDLGAPASGDPAQASRANPALGERALRLMRRDPEPFRIQLRALMRAAVAGPLRVMFPFASGPSDLQLILEVVEHARHELAREGVDHADHIPIGLNIEVPSAAATVDLLAPQVDFLSVGTNDLIQYLLAVDRADPAVSAFYEPLHPAILRTILGILRAARECDIPVSVCGEMAGHPVQAAVLVGLGVRELSMSASAIPRVKALIRRMDVARTGAVALECLKLPTAVEIERLVRQALAQELAESERCLG